MELWPRFSRNNVETQPHGGFMNGRQSMMGIWYMEAVSSGANVIDHLQNGINGGNAKQFAVMSVIAVLSSHRAINHLTDYVDAKQNASYGTRAAE